jgi:hypothetical protein
MVCTKAQRGDIMTSFSVNRLFRTHGAKLHVGSKENWIIYCHRTTTRKARKTSNTIYKCRTDCSRTYDNNTIESRREADLFQWRRESA